MTACPSRRRIARTILACGLALLLSACVAVPYQDEVWKSAPVSREGRETAAAERRVGAGDTVRVHTREGKTHIFRVYRLEDAAFHGVAKNKKKYRVVYDSLVAMEVLRVEEKVHWVPVGLPLHGVGNTNISFAGGGGLSPALLLLLLAPRAARRPVPQEN